MATIHIGTCGYSYKEWIGVLYPENTEESEFLTVYSKTFPFTELNFSYYKMPEAAMISRMMKKTGDAFFFTVKAHKSLTHTPSSSISTEADLFKKGIDPLVQNGRLGAILFQFPYSFHYTPKNRRLLDTLCSCFKGLPAALEFRNAEWQREEVYEECTQRNICYVNVDQPELPKLMKPGTAVTSDNAYIRFHGRNSENWWQGDNVSRYDYLYSDDELKSWIARIKIILKKARKLLITFNNHSRGQAVRNALTMKELLMQNGITDIL